MSINWCVITFFNDSVVSSKIVTELKSTVDFIDRKMESRISTCASETVSLLENKTDRLEQQAIQCNIQCNVQNLPEKRGENLVEILESIASAIRIPLTQRYK